jgi:Fe-S cluster biosynthesis and repair protein YggX
MSTQFRCSRCDGSDVDPVATAPFPTELGQRIRAEICVECWGEWVKRQMLLINHYGLKLNEASAREFLYTNLKAFLFGEGEALADIDSAREGSVEW